MPRPLSYVSLFSGAGGLDLGLEVAGWRTAYASDNDPFAVETLKANVGRRLAEGRRAFDGTFIEHADVRSLDAQAILSRAGLRSGDVQMLAGGPPCQSWSSAGHQLGFDDPRGRLVGDFVRVANDLDVRWLLIENVRGLLTARGHDGSPGSALSSIRHGLLRSGFQTSVALLNAADYGVPQRRVRLFIIGFRGGDAPSFAAPTHAKTPEALGLLPWIPLSDALLNVRSLNADEIIRPTGKMAADLIGVGPGSGVKSPGKAERTRPGGHWGYKQGAFVADPRQPARTVTAGAQQDWFLDTDLGLRRFCPRECAAFQSFPPDWRFHGEFVAQYRLIGNAVPPRLAASVGSALAKYAHREEVAEGEVARVAKFESLLPLPARLAYHIRYTEREEASNGQSRRTGNAKRVPRAAKAAMA